MDNFDESYWNPLQILAWVYLGDRELVRKASDRFEDRETVLIEVVERKLAQQTADRISEIDLVMHAALSPDRPNDGSDNAKKEIIDALVSSRISASGIRDGKTDRTPIDPLEWIDLDFFFHDDGRMYAGWTRVPRSGESRYKFVKVSREEIMRVWPDSRVLSRNEQLQRDANDLAQRWKSEKRRGITKRKISEELHKLEEWKSMKAESIERMIRKDW